MITKIRGWYVCWAHNAYPVRIDHSRMYIWVHVGLIMVGMSIVLHPKLEGLPTISRETNRILGLLIVWGSGLCLIACAMGVGWFFRDSKVDLRTPYGCGVFGQISVVASLLYYLAVLTFRLHLPWTTLLSLGLTYAICVALIHIDTVVVKEIWRIQHYKNHPDCPHWPKLAIRE